MVEMGGFLKSVEDLNQLPSTDVSLDDAEINISIICESSRKCLGVF